MSYELNPQIVRLVPFHSEGGALAAVDIAFGPITVSTKLYKTPTGFFLSLPSRKSTNNDKWYEQVSISDHTLKLKAQSQAVQEYEKLACGELVAV